MSMLHSQPGLLFYRGRHNPFIPVEFSAAAYRFGHPMLRPIYRLNTTLGKNPPPEDDPVNGRKVIFHPDDDAQSLNGFRTFPSIWAIEWKVFSDMWAHLPNVGRTGLQGSF